MSSHNDSNICRKLVEGRQKNVVRPSYGSGKDERANGLELRDKANNLQSKIATLKLWFLWLTVIAFNCLIVLLIVCILQSIRLNHLINPIDSARDQLPLSRLLDKEKLCLACDRLCLGPSQEEHKMLDIFRDANDASRCCVETLSQLTDLLSLYIERRLREEMARSKVKLLKDTRSQKPVRFVAAHLMGSDRNINVTYPSGRLFPIRKWIQDEDLAFTSNVAIQHGRIVVPADGFYFVYSHVSYLEVVHALNRSMKDGILAGNSFSFSHYIFRYNSLYPNYGEEKLIRSSFTANRYPKSTLREDSSFMGAVFRLRQSDELYVTVSSPAMLTADPKSSCFGFFRL